MNLWWINDRTEIFCTTWRSLTLFLCGRILVYMLSRHKNITPESIHRLVVNWRKQTQPVNYVRSEHIRIRLLLTYHVDRFHYRDTLARFSHAYGCKWDGEQLMTHYTRQLLQLDPVALNVRVYFDLFVFLITCMEARVLYIVWYGDCGLSPCLRTDHFGLITRTALYIQDVNASTDYSTQQIPLDVRGKTALNILGKSVMRPGSRKGEACPALPVAHPTHTTCLKRSCELSTYSLWNWK